MQLTNPMDNQPNAPDYRPGPFNNSSESKPKTFLARVGPLALRWALGVTILSAVADRFGLWGPPGTANVSWGDWPHFVTYTAKVNSFLPAVVAPALAVISTAAEALLGVALPLGVFPRPVAWASAVLLALFAGAMTLSFGIKAPLNYSVFVDAAAALALSVSPATETFRSTRRRA
jgi:putative oxidoreductase